MMHPFYCQMDYQNLPLRTTLPQDKRDAITACLCSSSMMIEGMLDLSFSPDECFRFALRCGLEDCADSLFPIFCGALAGRFSLRLTEETRLQDVLPRLAGPRRPWLLLPVRRDGTLIGTRQERLSHIVLVNGVHEEGYLMMDPMFRPGRSNRHIRRNRLRQDGDRTVVSQEVLIREYTGSPFFTFTKS